ncbi:MAG: ABC transporter permease [Planctomycetota bacterium]
MTNSTPLIDSTPLIELRNVHKTYHLGEVDVPVLKDVSLTIRQGEFVALMGASGSGKTTLMNLLGCLDRPTSGSYQLDGVEIMRLSRSELAQLRGSRIGFVFQSFNLLTRTTAVDNVRMPTSYNAARRSGRLIRSRATELLHSVGLNHRTDHSPGQMSGGEQQRVAIARSLINEPRLLLADEPTGNLDSKTGKEILALFRRLNTEQGITLLLVTHDPEVARHADRVIRMRDGRIVDDSPAEGSVQAANPFAAALRDEQHPVETAQVATKASRAQRLGGHRGLLRILFGAVAIAMQAQRRNPLRTALTMLGVIIGVAAVIAMMEISQGASSAIEVTVSNMGANTLLVTPGAPRAGTSGVVESVATLSPDDAEAIVRDCPHVLCAAPIVRARASVVHGNRDWRPNYMMGTTPAFLTARNWSDLELGRAFTEREVAVGAKVCLIGQTVVRELFGDQYPIGREIRVQNEPFTVVGVLSPKGANLMGVDQDDILLAPWTTMKYRISGGGAAGGAGGAAAGSVSGTAASGNSGTRSRATLVNRGVTGPTLMERLPSAAFRMRSESIEQILVQASAPEILPQAIDEITLMLRDRHRLSEYDPDFRVRDMAEASKALENTVRLMSGLGLSVAAVSLLVGGVGIMNIMLVSVTERTREIGLRMAVGANASDILRQFLVEAVVLCLLGGLVGIAAGRGASSLVGFLMDWPTRPSILAAVVAVAVSVVVGVTFGYYPAWKASRLNPIEALRYE